jgi:hypothetical protein
MKESTARPCLSMCKYQGVEMCVRNSARYGATNNRQPKHRVSVCACTTNQLMMAVVALTTHVTSVCMVQVPHHMVATLTVMVAAALVSLGRGMPKASHGGWLRLIGHDQMATYTCS